MGDLVSKAASGDPVTAEDAKGDMALGEAIKDESSEAIAGDLSKAEPKDTLEDSKVDIAAGEVSKESGAESAGESSDSAAQLIEEAGKAAASVEAAAEPKEEV